MSALPPKADMFSVKIDVDRLYGNEIPLTHEFLSLMLGVRRAGVTIALHYLEQRGIIQLSRGQIVILDREGLKASANGTYHEPEAPSHQSQADRASVPGREAELSRVSFRS